MNSHKTAYHTGKHCRTTIFVLHVLCFLTVLHAEISVPTHCSIRRVIGPIDGGVPELAWIADPNIGEGILSAVAFNGVVTFRLINLSGNIKTLGAFTSAYTNARVNRVRWDSSGMFDAPIHVTITGSEPGSSSPNTITTYLTLDATGNVKQRWQTGGVYDLVDYDFVISEGGPGLPRGIVLLDENMGSGTHLSTMDTSYTLTIMTSNSIPAGRTDTDVRGLELDKTGLYGGGVLLADSDQNHDGLTALYELRNVLGGGTYRLIGSTVSTALRFYGDLAISETGAFGRMAYITDQVTDTIQTVDTNGVHTTWASGFSGIDSLCISAGGDYMFVGDTNGVYLIFGDSPANQAGPIVLCHDPSTPIKSPMTGDAVTTLRIIFSEHVQFTDTDVTIVDKNGHAVAFDASGSGSQFMLVGLATPLFDGTYSITVSDNLKSVATGRSLDGNDDGVAGGSYAFSLTHVARWPPQSGTILEVK
jgi:hypothetical protein